MVHQRSTHEAALMEFEIDMLTPDGKEKVCARIIYKRCGGLT